MKKIVVDHEKCVGCGACVAMDNEHFDFNDQGLSYAKVQNNFDDVKLQEAITSCPVGAINIVDDEDNQE